MKLSTVSLFKNLKLDDEKFIELDSSTLRKYQLHLLKIMEDIVSICEQEGIYYALSGGSALGAVRHQGFIPWDDDMDIFILGSEREKFLKSFQNKFSDKYWIHSASTPDYGMPIGRIRQKGTILRGREDENFDEAGFFIDIFWVENTFDNPFARKIHGFCCLAVGLLLSCRNFYKNRNLMIEIMKMKREVRLVFSAKLIIGFITSFLSVRRWTLLTEFIYSLSRNNSSRFITIPSGRKHYFGEMFLRKDLVEVRKEIFESYSWNVPQNVENYLETMYGNWKEIPEQENREKHLILEIKFPETN